MFEWFLAYKNWDSPNSYVKCKSFWKKPETPPKKTKKRERLTRGRVFRVTNPGKIGICDSRFDPGKYLPLSDNMFYLFTRQYHFHELEAIGKNLTKLKTKSAFYMNSA